MLRRHVADEKVDRYLDPVQLNASYAVLFLRNRDQLKAVTSAVSRRAAFRCRRRCKRFDVLGDTDMLAYLAMMAPRLVELRRVLKPTGSIYLHCDPTAATIQNAHGRGVRRREFQNEIVWQRSDAHNDGAGLKEIWSDS